MPRCTVHRRHTVIRSCVGLCSVRFCISFVHSGFKVLKIGQYAKNDILVR